MEATKMTYTTMYNEYDEQTKHKTLRSATDCARSKLAGPAGYRIATICDMNGRKVAIVECFGLRTISTRC